MTRALYALAVFGFLANATTVALHWQSKALITLEQIDAGKAAW